MKFATVNSPAPLLNCPAFSEVFKTPLALDSQGRITEVEMVALPGMGLRVFEELGSSICRVALGSYPKEPLYTDRRWLEPSSSLISYAPTPPTVDEILAALERMEGLPYIWGGNWSPGIPELLALYPPTAPLEPLARKRWTLEGVDCSGMLYEATQGFTPRNTEELLHFGEAVPQGAALQPLDLIVWRGHVVIVFDRQRTIESACSAGGVLFCPLNERLEAIQKERGSAFSIRRWVNLDRAALRGAAHKAGGRSG